MRAQSHRALVRKKILNPVFLLSLFLSTNFYIFRPMRLRTRRNERWRQTVMKTGQFIVTYHDCIKLMLEMGYFGRVTRCRQSNVAPDICMILALSPLPSHLNYISILRFPLSVCHTRLRRRVNYIFAFSFIAIRRNSTFNEKSRLN